MSVVEIISMQIAEWIKSDRRLLNCQQPLTKEKVIEELKEEGCIIDDEAGNRAVEIIQKGGIE